MGGTICPTRSLARLPDLQKPLITSTTTTATRCGPPARSITSRRLASGSPATSWSR